jgi:hypothetical protein
LITLQHKIMNLEQLSKLKTKFVAREVGNELILVPLTGNVAQMDKLFTLNETAKFIWENMNGKSTVEQIQHLVTETFDIDATRATMDIENFITRLETMLSN